MMLTRDSCCMLYWVMLEGDFCCSAQCTGRFISDDCHASSPEVNDQQNTKNRVKK